jgi:hypothetical protein
VLDSTPEFFGVAQIALRTKWKGSPFSNEEPRGFRWKSSNESFSAFPLASSPRDVWPRRGLGKEPSTRALAVAERLLHAPEQCQQSKLRLGNSERRVHRSSGNHRSSPDNEQRNLRARAHMAIKAGSRKLRSQCSSSSLIVVREANPQPLDLTAVFRGIERGQIEALESHDQYTTIVRSKPSQMVLNHPKWRRPQR